MDSQLRELFGQVERHVSFLTRAEAGQRFSKDESRILALQSINRLNQHIGLIARSSKDDSGELKLLQTYVNNLTIGIKNDNHQLIRSALASTRSIIASLEGKTK